jgi:hypothetical protein
MENKREGERHAGSAHHSPECATRKKGEREGPGGVGGSPEKEEGTGRETLMEREERGRERHWFHRGRE